MDKFTKHDTGIIKGLAVLMLVCHHLGMGILQPPLDWANDSLLVIIATLCKVCVAIFVVLSGYGINESYKRYNGSDSSFVATHLIKLMKQYWFIFIIFVPLGFLCGENPFDVYGRNLIGFAYFILDFLGLKALFNTSTMNQTWWYMETVIVLYAAFPILRKLCRHIPVFVLAAAFVPLVIYSYFCDGSYDNCREIFWIFPFLVGIILSQNDVLNRFSAVLSRKYTSVCLLCILTFIIMTAVRSYFGVIADTFYAISIIAFAKATVCRIKYVNSFFGYMGYHSANIFMMHSFLYCYYVPIKQLLFVVNNGIFNYIVLIIECVAVSDYLEILKNRINELALKKGRKRIF